MISKKNILKNPSEFTLEQLIDAIDAHVVTYHELRDNAKMPLRPSVDYNLRNYSVNPEEFLYEQIRHSPTSEWISRYLRQFPQGRHIEQVKSLMPVSESTDVSTQQSLDQQERAAEENEAQNPWSDSSDSAAQDVPLRNTPDEQPTTQKTGAYSHPSIFSTRGRVNRGEYWLTIVLISIISYTIGAVVAAAPDAAILALFQLPLLWVNLAVCIKRSHDIGNSGWWILIPFYGLWLAFKRGDQFANEYGNKPE